MGKDAPCDIDAPHAHRYVNKYGFTKYIESERPKLKGYIRQDDYIYLDKEKQELLSTLNKYKLLRINDNIDKIKSDQKRNKGFYEYRYEHEELNTYPVIEGTGKNQTVTLKQVWETEYDWTRDINHDGLTGYRRYCDYDYYSYNISKDEKGRTVLIGPPETNDIISVKDEYPYIAEDYYELVYGDREEFDIKEERAKINGTAKRR
jgi:hypothetical protein